MMLGRTLITEVTIAEIKRLGLRYIVCLKVGVGALRCVGVTKHIGIVCVGLVSIGACYGHAVVASAVGVLAASVWRTDVTILGTSPEVRFLEATSLFR